MISFDKQTGECILHCLERKTKMCVLSLEASSWSWFDLQDTSWELKLQPLKISESCVMKSRWGDKPLVDAGGWCVSVDFNVRFLIFGDLNVFAFPCKSRDLAGNHRARGVVWQLMQASQAAWRILKRLYGSRRWWWMYTTLWGIIIRILP